MGHTYRRNDKRDKIVRDGNTMESKEDKESRTRSYRDARHQMKREEDNELNQQEEE